MNELTKFLDKYEHTSGKPVITRVYLIRHGATLGSEERRYKGHIDVPLSENGIKQAAKLRRYFEKIPNHSLYNVHNSEESLNCIYASDLSRARRSAEIIAKPFKLKPVIIPQLRERRFGHWEGMTFDEIRNIYPKEFDAWANDPLRFSPIGGESTEAVSKRIMPAFYDILKRHINRKIIIIAHGGVNRIILCNILSISLQNIFRLEQDFACINIIEYFDDMPVLKVMNYTL